MVHTTELGYKSVSVISTSDDGLEQTIWGFYYSDSDRRLLPDKYFDTSRPTRRHKFVVNYKYMRLDMRSNNIDNPHIPMWVCKAAHAAFTDSVIVQETFNGITNS